MTEDMKKIDLELWNLLGRGYYHTHQQLKLAYLDLQMKAGNERIRLLNLKSKFNTEDLS